MSEDIRWNRDLTTRDERIVRFVVAYIRESVVGVASVSTINGQSTFGRIVDLLDVMDSKFIVSQMAVRPDLGEVDR